MTVNLSNRNVSIRTEFTIEDAKDIKGLWVTWKNRFHRYDICPCGKKTATDLLKGNASDDDWILLVDGMYEESVGIAEFLKKFLETHASALCRKIRFYEKEGRTNVTIMAHLKWNKYRMSETSYVGTLFEN